MTDARARAAEVFVVLQGGLVQKVVALPAHIRLTVIDYDTEGVDDERLEKSPLSGKPCCLARY